MLNTFLVILLCKYNSLIRGASGKSEMIINQGAGTGKNIVKKQRIYYMTASLSFVGSSLSIWLGNCRKHSDWGNERNGVPEICIRGASYKLCAGYKKEGFLRGEAKT